VLFCTPEYAGRCRQLQELLDWTVGGGQLYGKPAAWLNVAADAGNRRAGNPAERPWLPQRGHRRIRLPPRPVDRSAIGADGMVTDPAVRAAIAEVLAELIDYRRRRHRNPRQP